MLRKIKKVEPKTTTPSATSRQILQYSSIAIIFLIRNYQKLFILFTKLHKMIETEFDITLRQQQHKASPWQPLVYLSL